MKSFKWLPTLLAAIGLVWCVVAGWMIWVTPVRYLRYSSFEPEPRYVNVAFSEVSALGIAPLVVPTLLAGLATWCTWRQRTVSLCALTILFVVYSFISGFSIGGAYVPAAGVLVIATLVTLMHAGVTRTA
jgi:hypothetical protein